MFTRLAGLAQLLIGLSLAVWGPLSSLAGPSNPDPRPAPVQAGHHQALPVEQIRPGMKGYGLTVFQGAEIEPFAVEVIGVMHDFGPKRSVIWIRCPQQRMKEMGPVQGMSGSPIYLWTDDGPHEPGEGGHLIGAYAYGFAAATDCIVGVQPIELMLDVAGRARTDRPPGQTSQHGGARHRQLATNLRQLVAMARHQGWTPTDWWRVRALNRLIERGRRPEGEDRFTAPAVLAADPPVPSIDPGRLPRSIPTPLAVNSAHTATVLAPLLGPMGITPVPRVSGQGRVVAGRPPPGMDPKTIDLQPGSVLSIPLAFGDLDLSAVGTVTDVLPDGRVMAFGHSLFGQGPINVPMANGYVHLIMPSLFSSFKLGGSGEIRGSVVRDEHSAVVGVPQHRYATSPVKVTLDLPGQPPAEYRYEVVQHKELTPAIATAVVMESVLADRSPPIENTMRLRGQMVFTGDRVIELDSVAVDGTGFMVVVELFPMISTMMLNPHESLMLESMQMTATVEPTRRDAMIVSAQLDRAGVAPGETIGVTLQIHPYGQDPIKQRVEVEVPAGAAAGEYELILCDAMAYTDMLFDTHPHLLYTAGVDDFQAVIQRLLRVSNDALYVILQLPQPALAIGRQELPRLPSSRRAILETQANTSASLYREWVEKEIPMGMVLEGELRFNIEVQ